MLVILLAIGTSKFSFSKLCQRELQKLNFKNTIFSIFTGHSKVYRSGIFLQGGISGSFLRVHTIVSPLSSIIIFVEIMEGKESWGGGGRGSIGIYMFLLTWSLPQPVSTILKPKISVWLIQHKH